MIEHIVKQNERINDILNNYHLTFEDIKKNNSHITDFNNLIGGTKLMIPLMKEEVEQILDKTEVFVKKYYPKLTDDIIPSTYLDEKETNNLVENKPIIKEEVKEVNEKKENITRGIPYPGILPPKAPYRKI